jgi:hypothetical protein
LQSTPASFVLLGVNLEDDSASAAMQRSEEARETALYEPVKKFLESRGYEVKGEVRGCDLVARRGDEPLLIVELKLRFNLGLVLQGIDRLALTERVYLAVPRPPRRSRGTRFAPDRPNIRKLCRRLGLGLIAVDSRRTSVEILEEPVPYRPRRAKTRALRLVDEFARRVGDANIGGAVGIPLVTAYRQDALRCAQMLAMSGPMHLRTLRTLAGVPAAARILQRNVYGWFARIERGTYGLTAEGSRAVTRFSDAIPDLVFAKAS